MITYYEGGFDASKPAKNRWQMLTLAGGYVEWDEAGQIVEQRDLTESETLALTPPEEVF